MCMLASSSGDEGDRGAREIEGGIVLVIGASPAAFSLRCGEGAPKTEASRSIALVRFFIAYSAAASSKAACLHLSSCLSRFRLSRSKSLSDDLRFLKLALKVFARLNGACLLSTSVACLRVMPFAIEEMTSLSAFSASPAILSSRIFFASSVA